MTEKKKVKIELDEKTAKVFEHKHYTVKELLGQGTYGKVYKAQRDKDGIYAAVKVIDPELMQPLERDKFLPRELESLKKIRHPHVLEIFDIFKSNKKIYIFMEFSPNGDLSDVVQKNGAIAIPQAKKWFRQTADALAFMHDKMNIVHRDIKLENVLLSVTFDAKLADFGFTRPQTGSLCETICGTTPYYSPELSCHSLKPYDAKAADVWAMGCLLFAMTVARLPFADWPGKNGKPTLADWQNFHKDQMARAYKKREGYSKLPADIRDLIEKCMEPDVKKRITAHQILLHPALKGVSGSKLPVKK